MMMEKDNGSKREPYKFGSRFYINEPNAYRDAGLWLPMVYARIEPVGPKHRKVCCVCGKTPEVGTERLHVKVGSGRAQVSQVYCEVCSVEWFLDRQREIRLAIMRLRTGFGCVRLPHSAKKRT